MSIWLGILNVIDGKVDVISSNVDTLLVNLAIVDGKVTVIDGLHDVPSKDSVDNVHIRDVVGNKTDSHTGTSIVSTVHTIEEHAHSIARVYPRLANPIQLQKDAGVWAAIPSTKTEIVPAGTILKDFDIHWVQVGSISANGSYMICLYGGTAGNEVLIGEVAVSRSAVQSQEGSVLMLTPIVDAETRISAGISSSNNAQDTLLIKVMYHEY